MDTVTQNKENGKKKATTAILLHLPPSRSRAPATLPSAWAHASCGHVPTRSQRKTPIRPPLAAPPFPFCFVDAASVHLCCTGHTEPQPCQRSAVRAAPLTREGCRQPVLQSGIDVPATIARMLVPLLRSHRWGRAHVLNSVKINQLGRSCCYCRWCSIICLKTSTDEYKSTVCR